MITKRGYAIALAWPETYCKQAGAWYDAVTRFLGYLRMGYYQAGHAAIILVDSSSGECRYFDFGRYHAPFGHGRVRSALTDSELQIQNQAVFNESNTAIANLPEILEELQGKTAFHGEGMLYAAQTAINYDSALKKALHMQKTNPHQYGPFVKGGTNCSRFVYGVILAGNPRLMVGLRIRIVKPVTPSPMSNVHAFGNTVKSVAIRENLQVLPKAWPSKEFMNSTLAAPPKPDHLPENARWLAGEGAGSWFVEQISEGQSSLLRYSPDGQLESSKNRWSDFRAETK